MNILDVRHFTEKTGRSLIMAIEHAVSRHESQHHTLPDTLEITQDQLALMRKARNTTSYLATLKPDSNLYMFYSPIAAMEVLIEGLVVATRSDFREGITTPNLHIIDDHKPNFIETDRELNA